MDFNKISKPTDPMLQPILSSKDKEIRLEPPKKSWLETGFFLLRLNEIIKVNPVGSALYWLVSRLFSKIVAYQGIGSNQASNVDQVKRAALKALGGVPVKFGFKGNPLIEGMLFEQDPKAKTILLCTGSHRSFEEYAYPMVDNLKAMGYNVMVLNYEGFGNSEGSISEEGIYRSVEAGYQFLIQEKKIPPANVIGWGYSLGSAAVSHLAQKHHIDVVLDRGFSSMDKVAYKFAPSPLKTVAKIIFSTGSDFDNISKLKNSKGRIFVAQAKYDSTMDSQNHGDVLNASLTENKSRLIYKKVISCHMHTDQDIWFAVGEDKEAIKKFLEQHSQ